MSRIPPKDNRLGVQHVAGPDKRLLDVVFIHGLSGDAWTTWMSDPDDDSTFWPDWLAAEFPNLGIWTVGYAADATRWTRESMPIADQATTLLHALEINGIGQRPVVFITHSLGGILAKQLLRHATSFDVERWEPIANKTAGMVFLGTPHSGADIANFVTFVGAVLRINDPVMELQSHSSRLGELHTAFLAFQRKKSFAVRTFCEKRKVRLWLPLGWLRIKIPKGILVVNQTSAEPNIPGEVAVPLPEDHISICKPPNRKADMYRGVVGLIKELTATISRPVAVEPTIQRTDSVPEDSGGHDLSRIQRYAPEELIGRDDELAELDEAWDKARRAATPRPHVLTYVALGGEGKTALIAHWAAQLASHDWPGCDAAFAWSFYSQGTRDQGDASADVFLAEALRFFGDPAMADSAASAWDKGRRLAQLVGDQSTLLILDGLEPLQYAPTSPTKGELKEGGIVALLRGLSDNNAGLCIVTTRYSIPDLNAYRQTIAPEIELTRLSTKAGVNLLQELGVRQESGTQEQFETLVEDVKGHALTLNLLGKYLADAHAGDIRKRDLVKLQEADVEEQGGHAFRVMDVYVDWFEGEGDRGRQAIALLRLTGLFDRAASADSIAALKEPPVIEKLTEPLVDLSDAQQNLAFARLEEARLITVERDEAGALRALDCHPLIREYFAKRLQDEQPHAWRAGHKRLFEHLCKTTKEGDEPTLEKLQPLYQAVTHGCLAGLQQKACDEVYTARILKGTSLHGGFYSWKKLGAIGADLGAVANFFDRPWSRVSTALTEANRSWLLNEAALRLRALGRLREAVEPMQVAGEMDATVKNWLGAAITYSNRSELSLTLGDVSEAVRAAEKSVDYADRTGHANYRWVMRTTLADALAQVGGTDDARAHFAEAESMQKEDYPKETCLYSLQGFQYCDLLLAPLEWRAWQARLLDATPPDAADPPSTLDDIEQRAVQTLDLVLGLSVDILSPSLDYLTLARVALYRSRLEQKPLPDPSDPESHIARAVTGLRKAGASHHLPRGLLTLAWYRHEHGDEAGARAALDEAAAIALRGPMPLHLADIHLYRARLFADRAELDKARALIQKHGYNRRLPELHDADAALPAG